MCRPSHQQQGSIEKQSGTELFFELEYEHKLTTCVWHQTDLPQIRLYSAIQAQ